MKLIPFTRDRKKQTDQELLTLFLKKQNPEVLGELYARYMHLVYGVCLRYFKEPEKSKDAVINIYEKIQNDVHNHTIKNFKSWLYVVTKNHCLMELRKKKPGNLIFASGDEKLTNFMEKEPELHPMDIEPIEEIEKALKDCIDKLKIEQKECIRLFYFENKCYREISTLLKTEEKKVKSFIQNGKRNLKICLEKKK